MREIERFVYGPHYSHLQEQLALMEKRGQRIDFAFRTVLECILPLKMKPGSKVLDVGAGIGSLGRVLSPLGIRTVNLDISPHALKKGKNLYGETSRATHVQADAIKLPFTDRSFDFVISQDFFEHLETEALAQQTLHEMGRVLRGKKMMHKVTVLEDERWIHEDESHYLKESATWWKDWFEKHGWKAIRPTSRKIVHVKKWGFETETMHGFFILKRK